MQGCCDAGNGTNATVQCGNRGGCDSAGATVTFLRTGSRTGVLPALRKQLARKAVNEYGISLAETARQFGVTANAVSHMLKRQYRNATQT